MITREEIIKLKNIANIYENLHAKAGGFDITAILRLLEHVEKLEAALACAEKALSKLSKSGDGSHADRHASFYDCLPELQIEFSERKYIAIDTLSEISKIKGEMK